MRHRIEMRTELGKTVITPLVYPSFNPELGLKGSAGLVMSFKTARKERLQRSLLQASAGLTTTGAWDGNAQLNSFWAGNKLRIEATARFRRMPDNYYGLDFDRQLHLPRTDSTTGYMRDWVYMFVQPVWEVLPNFFVGVQLVHSRNAASEMAPPMAEDPLILRDGTDVRTGGAGGILRYDTRNSPFATQRGLLLEVANAYYGHFFGGRFHFQTLQFDARYFRPLMGNTRHILALQGRTRFSFGEVPWSELSLMGGEFGLRGYPLGRFRDRNLFYGQAEYRYTFATKRKEPSPHSVAGWVGAGQVFGDQNRFFDHRHWLPSIGGGYRLEIQPNMNVRVDYGFGRKSGGLYVAFSDAF